MKEPYRKGEEMSPQFAKLYSVGQRGQARLPGSCIDGEPQRAFGGDVSDRGQWQSGTRCSEANGRRRFRWKRVTLAGDKNYDTQELVRDLRG